MSATEAKNHLSVLPVGVVNGDRAVGNGDGHATVFGLESAADMQRLPRRVFLVFGEGERVFAGVTQRSSVEDAGGAPQSRS